MNLIYFPAISYGDICAVCFHILHITFHLEGLDPKILHESISVVSTFGQYKTPHSTLKPPLVAFITFDIPLYSKFIHKFGLVLALAVLEMK